MSYYKLLLAHAPQTEWADNAFLLEMTCGAVGGGLFAAGAILGNATACALGLVVACVCKGLLLLKDLGRPERFLKVMLKPFGSWLSFGAWALLLFGFFGFIHTLALLLDIPPGGGALLIKVLAIAFAVVIITYDGLLMASSRAISSWSSGMIAPLFATNALASGCALLLAFFPAQGLALATLGLLAGELVILGCHLAVLRGGPTGARVSYGLLLFGSERLMLQGGAVGLGLVLPLLITGLWLIGGSVPATVLLLSALLAAGGVFCLRTALLRSGVTTPVL